MIDHTLSWEIARVGGMLALVLATASVLIGLALSLKVRSTHFPSFRSITTHREVTSRWRRERTETSCKRPSSLHQRLH